MSAPTRAPLRCKHCPNSTLSSPDAARMMGWRMWSGTTVGGQEKNDIVCPSCAGVTPASEPTPSWGVRCNTCDWQWEDEYEEGPLTPKEAKSTAQDHECEPDVQIATPQGLWIRPSLVSDDGTLKERAR